MQTTKYLCDWCDKDLGTHHLKKATHYGVDINLGYSGPKGGGIGSPMLAGRIPRFAKSASLLMNML